MITIPKPKPFDASQVADAIGPGRFESELITQEKIKEGGLEAGSPEPTRKNLANLTIAEAMWKRVENEKFANMQSFSMPGENEDFEGGQNWWDSLGSVEGAEETETFKAFQSIHTNLSPEEKEAFEFFRLDRFAGFIDKHESIIQQKESNAVLFSYEQDVSASMETARANPYDLLAIEDEKSNILKSTILLGNDQGYTVEQVNELFDQHLSTFHVNQFHALLENNDPHGAKEYLDGNLDQVLSENHEPLKSLVDDKVFFFDAKKLADRIVDGPWEEHFQAIEAIEDETLRETVRKMVHDKQNSINEAKESLQREFSGAIMDEMSKGAGKFSDNEIAAIPTDQLAQLTPQTQEMIKRYANKKDDVVSDKIDSASLGQIWNVIADDPEGFLKLDIRGNYVGQLSKEHQDELREKQIKYNTATPEEKKAMLARDKMVADIIKDWTLMRPEHYEITGNFINDFNNRLSKAKEETGEELSLARFGEILEKTVNDHAKKFSDHKKMVAEGKHTLDGTPSHILIERGLDQHKIYRKNERDKLKEIILDKIIITGEGLGRNKGLNEKERRFIMEGVLSDMVNINTARNSISSTAKEIAVNLLEPDIGIRKMPWANYNLLSKEQKERTFVTITSLDKSGHLESFSFHMGQLENLNEKTRKQINSSLFQKGVAPNRQNQVLEFLRMKNPTIEYRAPGFGMKLRFNLEASAER